jgi:hypothetical protein
MPKGKPFPPGVSGNPKGRPPGRGLSKTARQLTEEIGTEYNPRTGKTKDQHFMEGLYRRACQGSAKAQELWAAYRWHRPLQAQLNVNADLPSDDESLREVEEALREMRAGNESVIQ